MLRRAYTKQLTEFLQRFNIEELNEYIPFIEPYFMNEKYSEENLFEYVDFLSANQNVITDWLKKLKEDKFPNEIINVKMFQNFLNSIKEDIVGKKMMFLTSFDSSLPVLAAKLGADVVVYDRYNHAIASYILESIKNDVYILPMAFIGANQKNLCDYIIAFQCFQNVDETHRPAEYWNYLKQMESEGKTIYIVSTRIMNGTHPVIKLDKEPNIVYNENIDGIERVVFNGI